MESSRSRSVFVNIGLRELNGFRGYLHTNSFFYCISEFQLLRIILNRTFFSLVSVRKRPFFADSELICREIAGVAVEHDGIWTPPLAVSFCKV